MTKSLSIDANGSVHMTRTNDALGRTFVETEFRRTNKGVDRVVVGAEREYTIAGRYTQVLSDVEVRQEYPPLYDRHGKMLPSVFPSVQTQSTKGGKRRA